MTASFKKLQSKFAKLGFSLSTPCGSDFATDANDRVYKYTITSDDRPVGNDYSAGHDNLASVEEALNRMTFEYEEHVNINILTACDIVMKNEDVQEAHSAKDLAKSARGIYSDPYDIIAYGKIPNTDIIGWYYAGFMPKILEQHFGA